MAAAFAGFAGAVALEYTTTSAGLAALYFTFGICWAAVFGALAVAVWI